MRGRALVGLLVLFACVGTGRAAICTATEYKTAALTCVTCGTQSCPFGVLHECGDLVPGGNGQTYDRICVDTCKDREAECLFGNCTATDICTCRLGFRCQNATLCDGKTSSGQYGYNVTRTSFSRSACPSCACIDDARITPYVAPPSGGCNVDCSTCVRTVCQACTSPKLLQNGSCVTACGSGFYRNTDTTCTRCSTDVEKPCPYGVSKTCGTAVTIGGTLQVDRTCTDNCFLRRAKAGTGAGATNLCYCNAAGTPGCRITGQCDNDFGYKGSPANAPGYWFDWQACPQCQCENVCSPNSFVETTAFSANCRCPVDPDWTCSGTGAVCKSGTISGGIQITYFELECMDCKCNGPPCNAGSFLDKDGNCRCALTQACTGDTCTTASLTGGGTQALYKEPCLNCQCSGGGKCSSPGVRNINNDCVCPASKPCEGSACLQRLTEAYVNESYFDPAACADCTCLAPTTTSTTTTTTTVTTTTTTTPTTTTRPTTASRTTGLPATLPTAAASKSSATAGIAAGAGAGGAILLIVVIVIVVMAYRARDRNKLSPHEPMEYFNPVYTGNTIRAPSSANAQNWGRPLPGPPPPPSRGGGGGGGSFGGRSGSMERPPPVPTRTGSRTSNNGRRPVEEPSGFDDGADNYGPTPFMADTDFLETSTS